MQTDDIPFLVQRALHVSDGTTIDVGVVCAIDAEVARQLAIERGLVEPLQTFHVLSLRSWHLDVPAHFVEEAPDELVAEHASLNTYLSMHARAETPDQLGEARVSPALHAYLSERQRRICARLVAVQAASNVVTKVSGDAAPLPAAASTHAPKSIEALCETARRVAVPDIQGDWDRLVLACEEYDLHFDPQSLTAEEREYVLDAWRQALPGSSPAAGTLGHDEGRPNPVVTAVANALLATHAHHDHSIGAPRADGLTPLSLDGKGEFHDHRWLLAPDGTVTDDASPVGT